MEKKAIRKIYDSVTCDHSIVNREPASVAIHSPNPATADTIICRTVSSDGSVSFVYSVASTVYIDMAVADPKIYSAPSSPAPPIVPQLETKIPIRITAIPAILFLDGYCFLKRRISGTIIMPIEAYTLAEEAGIWSSPSFSNMLLSVISTPRISPCLSDTLFRSRNFRRITSASMIPATPDVSAKYAYTEKLCGMSLIKM